jgi:hypothetical protein
MLSCCLKASSGRRNSTCPASPALGQSRHRPLICVSLALTLSTDLSSTAACSRLFPASSHLPPIASRAFTAQHRHAQPGPNPAQHILHNGEGGVMHKRRLPIKLHLGQQFQRFLNVGLEPDVRNQSCQGTSFLPPLSATRINSITTAFSPPPGIQRSLPRAPAPQNHSGSPLYILGSAQGRQTLHCSGHTTSTSSCSCA